MSRKLTLVRGAATLIIGCSPSPSASRNHCAQLNLRYKACWNPFLRGALNSDRCTAVRPFSVGVDPVPVRILPIVLVHSHVGDIVLFTPVSVVDYGVCYPVNRPCFDCRLLTFWRDGPCSVSLQT